MSKALIKSELVSSYDFEGRDLPVIKSPDGLAGSPDCRFIAFTYGESEDVSQQDIILVAVDATTLCGIIQIASKMLMAKTKLLDRVEVLAAAELGLDIDEILGN